MPYYKRTWNEWHGIYFKWKLILCKLVNVTLTHNNNNKEKSNRRRKIETHAFLIIGIKIKIWWNNFRFSNKLTEKYNFMYTFMNNEFWGRGHGHEFFEREREKHSKHLKKIIYTSKWWWRWWYNFYETFLNDQFQL